MKEYLRQNKGMKVMFKTFNTFKSIKTNEEVRHTVKNRRYKITNEEEITHVSTQIATDIEFQMGKMELSKSGLVITQIDTLQFNMDKFSPTRGGKFIPLSNGLQTKRRVSKFKTKTTNVSSIPSNVVYAKTM